MLRDINFGNIDAKNELMNDTEEEREKFRQSYLVPDNLNVQNLETGSKFFIYGLKGTGKTALLRYIEIELKRKGYNTSFILFKSDLTEDDRRNMASGNYEAISESNFKGQDEKKDFENIWTLFFFRYIANVLRKSKLSLNNQSVAEFVACAGILDLEPTDRFLPRIKDGTIKLGTETLKLELNLNFGDSKRVKLADYLKILRDKLIYLSLPVNKKMYIMLDELELVRSSKKAYDRDSALIRDLIVVVDKLNRLFREKHIEIYIVASIRSEVLNAVASIGKEINKTIEDFGVLISWHQAGGNEKEHPLIRMIIKRLLVAEHWNETPSDVDKIRAKYFPDKEIQNSTVERYILNNTWYRPRDVVRMMNLAKDNFPNENGLSHRVFDGIRKQYSSKSWTECKEELSAHYTSDVEEIVEEVLNGWERTFSLNDFLERIHEVEKNNAIALNELSKKEVILLNRLYDVGVIGNKYESKSRWIYRFVFRGDEKLLPQNGMMVHQALWPYFSLTS